MTTASSDQELVAIDVPADVAAAVNARIRSGEYASQGDVVRDGLRSLNDEDSVLRDPDVDRWLRTTVVPIAEATIADPARSIGADEVRKHFVSKRTNRA